ncbi:MAG: ABC transporter permease [Halodesulfurarchaeum sp.]
MRRLRLARRELASLRREKTVVLAVVVQLAVAAFSSFLFVGLVALYSPAGAAGAGVTVDIAVTGNATDRVAPIVADGGARRVSTFGNRTRAVGAFRDGRVDAVMIATLQPAGNVTIQAIAPDGDFRTTLVVVQLRDALGALERTLRADYSDRLRRDPVPVPPEGEGSPFFGFAYTVPVPLLVLMPAFISGSIAVDSLTEELERGTLELLRVAPVTAGEIIDGKSIAAIGIAPLQAVAWLALLALNGTPVAHPAVLAGLVGAFATILVGIGALLAVGVGDRRSAQLLYSLGALALVALATLLPEGPVNAIAKLAIDSPTPVTWAVVGGLFMLAVASYLASRRLGARALGAA